MRNLHPNRTVPMPWRGLQRYTLTLPADVAGTGAIGLHTNYSTYVTIPAPYLDATWSFYPPRPELDSSNVNYLEIAVELYTAAPLLHATRAVDTYTDFDTTSVYRGRQSCTHLSGTAAAAAEVITKFRYKVTASVVAGTGSWSVSFHGAGTNETTAFAVRW